MIVLNEEYKNKLDNYYEMWVSSQGKCEHMAGEIIRALAKILYRYENDGDCIGIGYGNETCNAPARFLRENINDDNIKQIIDYIWANENRKIYEFNLQYLIESIIDYIDAYPELQERISKDMWDYYIDSIDNILDEDNEFDEDI